MSNGNPVSFREKQILQADNFHFSGRSFLRNIICIEKELDKNPPPTSLFDRSIESINLLRMPLLFCFGHSLECFLKCWLSLNSNDMRELIDVNKSHNLRIILNTINAKNATNLFNNSRIGDMIKHFDKFHGDSDNESGKRYRNRYYLGHAHIHYGDVVPEDYFSIIKDIDIELFNTMNNEQ